jgi:hypothetical protein
VGERWRVRPRGSTAPDHGRARPVQPALRPCGSGDATPWMAPVDGDGMNEWKGCVGAGGRIRLKWGPRLKWDGMRVARHADARASDFF